MKNPLFPLFAPVKLFLIRENQRDLRMASLRWIPVGGAAERATQRVAPTEMKKNQRNPGSSPGRRLWIKQVFGRDPARCHQMGTSRRAPTREALDGPMNR